jgi:murein DD-endopeptidase MepM/ murein hydrolase activator NlpD
VPGPVKNAAEAAQALEATLIRQLLASSGAFKGSDAAGGQVHADMFVEALADAVAKGGGLGLANLLQKSLGPQADATTQPHADGMPGASMPRPAFLSAPTAETPAVTSGYGWRMHPIDGVEKFHTGVDLRAPEGAPIAAAADGTVVSAGLRGGYGNVVELQHRHGQHTQ